MTQTYCFSILAVSRATFDEIQQAMIQHGFATQIRRGNDPEDVLLNMEGLALQVDESL